MVYAYRWPCSSLISYWEMLGPWLHDWKRPQGRRCSFWETQPMAGVNLELADRGWGRSRDPGLMAFPLYDSV